MLLRRLSLICTLSAGLLHVSAGADSDFWNTGAKDWTTPDTPPEGWSFDGDIGLALHPSMSADGQASSVWLEMENVSGKKSELAIPYPALPPYPQATIELKLGSTPTEQTGLNWFLKKGNWELRADNEIIYLHDPKTHEQVPIGAYAADQIQTITLTYNAEQRAIIAASVDGVEAANLKPFPAAMLSTRGELTLYATTSSTNTVWFESLSIRGDEKYLAQLPRWYNPDRAEEDTGEPPELPSWDPR